MTLFKRPGVCAIRRRFKMRLLAPSRIHRDDCQSKSWRREDAEKIAPRFHQLRKEIAEIEVVADVLLQALDSPSPQHEPDLERSETPPKRDLPVTVVGHQPAVCVRVAEICRGDAQGAGQVRSFLHVQSRSVEIRQQPFVHVHVEGVDEGHMLGEVLVLGQHERGSGVGGVAVDPDVRVVAGHGGDGGEVVCCAGVCRADADGQVVGLQAFGGEFFEFLAQVLSREGVGCFSCRYDTAVSSAGDDAGFLGATVRLLGTDGDQS